MYNGVAFYLASCEGEARSYFIFAQVGVNRVTNALAIFYSSFLLFLSSVLFGKCFEIALDMYWTWRKGHKYSEAVLKELRRRGRVNIDAMDAKYGRPQYIWRWTSKRHVDLQRLMDFLYRVPVLLLLQGITLITVIRHLGQEVVIVSLIAVWVGITISVANAFVQRLFFGWFDSYKRAISLRVSRKYMLHTHRVVSAKYALGKVLFVLVTLIYQSIMGYAVIYFGLYRIDPFAFYMTIPCRGLGFVQFVYFSSVTAATVGFGDIRPVSNMAEICVTLQILTGPLLLSLFLLAISYSSTMPLMKKEGNKLR
jgi:hypothetical protein